jgi:predicted NBD/HSP70 family sugar kinase
MEIGACPYTDGRAIEETVSAGGLVRLFREELGAHGADADARPVRIAELAREGGASPAAAAAARALARFGAALGFGVNWALGLLDPDLIVIGGGVAGAWDVMAPHLFAYLRSRHATSGRLRCFKRIFDLANAEEREEFLREETTVMAGKKTGIARSGLDTAEAIMLGAYRLALRELAPHAAVS